jgi:hypothetical protein
MTMTNEEDEIRLRNQEMKAALVKLIEQGRDGHVGACNRPGPPEHHPHTVVECIADRIIAAGWRPPLREGDMKALIESIWGRGDDEG